MSRVQLLQTDRLIEVHRVGDQRADDVACKLSIQETFAGVAERTGPAVAEEPPVFRLGELVALVADVLARLTTSDTNCVWTARETQVVRLLVALVSRHRRRADVVLVHLGDGFPHVVCRTTRDRLWDADAEQGGNFGYSQRHVEVRAVGVHQQPVECFVDVQVADEQCFGRAVPRKSHFDFRCKRNLY